MFDFGIINEAEASIVTLMKSVNKVLINPIIFLLFAVAMVYFLYGLVQYLLSPGNEEVHKRSKSVMLWGIIGLFIMTAVFGIMKIILNTLGENKIKINNNGDYVVDLNNQNGAPDIADRNIVDNKKTGQSLLDPTKASDVSEIVGSSDDKSIFTKSPFPTYEKNNSCWNEAITAKSTTEFEALRLAKESAKTKYLASGGTLRKDKYGNYEYPTIFSSMVLYDKSTKTYYAWIDVRMPKTGATASSCDLKILAPAPNIPDAIITDRKDTSSNSASIDLPITTFTNSPFPKYEKKPLCWNKTDILGTGSIEYDATKGASETARALYLKENNVSYSDKTKANYPITFDKKILYNSKTSTYYTWLDVRAPLGTGTLEKDCDLKILEEAPVIPEAAVFSGEVSVSETTEKSTVKSFTTNPFSGIYEENNACWHAQDYDAKSTEYATLQAVKAKLRNKYLSDNGLKSASTPENLPIIYGMLTSYDTNTKNYYVWLDVRAPKGQAKLDVCNLRKIGDNALPAYEPAGRSGKKIPFVANYQSDDVYFRVVDSGANQNYYLARVTAINNALYQLARLKSLNSIYEVTIRTILEERYYPKDDWTGNYDYFVAIESPR